MRQGQIYQPHRPAVPSPFTGTHYYRRIIILFLLAFAAAAAATLVVVVVVVVPTSSNLPGDPKLSFVKFTCLESKISLQHSCAVRVVQIHNPLLSLSLSYYIPPLFFSSSSSSSVQRVVLSIYFISLFLRAIPAKRPKNMKGSAVVNWQQPTLLISPAFDD